MDNRLIKKLDAIITLTDEDRRALDGMCENVGKVLKGEDVIRDGDCTDDVHLIIEGWAYRYKILEDGSRQITAFLIPGDFCDMHVAVLGEMDHNIGALTDTTVGYIPRDQMNELIERPQIARAFWWATLVDEAVLRAWIVNLGRRDAFHRIAHLICEMHLRMQNIGLVEDNCFDLPLTQEELADTVGITTVHANRILRRLRQADLIELRRGRMTIKDVQRLQQESGFDPRYLHQEAASHA